MASTKPSVRHPCHSHPLRGHKAQAEEEIICSGCDLDLIGEAFKCTKSECDYFLHKSCFDLPRAIRHNSHPDHPLTLLYSPPYKSAMYRCNGCRELGSGFTYHCSICQYDLHVGCVSMPQSVMRGDHTNPLTLLYRSPFPNGMKVICDVCQQAIPDNSWWYRCKECDYDTHLHSCAVEEEKKEEPKRGGGGGGGSGSRSRTARNGGKKGGKSSGNSELASMLKAQREMEKMQIELHLQMEHDKMMKKARKQIRKMI